ncbi:hypothetical protein ACWEJ6_43330 [Nonomuraea sp. NPDC004702]
MLPVYGVFRLHGGSLADRWPPRPIMLAADVVRTSAAGLLRVLAWNGEDRSKAIAE